MDEQQENVEECNREAFRRKREREYILPKVQKPKILTLSKNKTGE